MKLSLPRIDLAGWAAGFGRRFRAAAGERKITTSQDLAKAWGFLFGAQSAAGVHVSAESAEGIAAVARAVRLLSETIAGLPLDLFRRDGERREALRDDPLYELLHWAPNELQTSFQWRALMERDVELRGNAYSLIVRGAGDVILRLYRLHPDTVRPKMDARGEVTYEHTRADGKVTVYRRQDILHLWMWSDDGLVGRSPIQVHRDALGEGIAMVRHASRLFANGARPSGILTTAADVSMGADSMKALREDVAELYQGTENAYGVIVLPGGLDFKPVTMNMDDTQFIQSRKLSVTEVARIFGVPPHKLGDLEKATFSNIEHQALEYVSDTILPRVTMWEQAIRRALLGAGDRYVKLNVAGLLRGDMKSRAEALQIWRRNGIINADEWRALEDLNPIEGEGGDLYIVEGNMSPLDKLGDLADAQIERGAGGGGTEERGDPREERWRRGQVEERAAA